MRLIKEYKMRINGHVRIVSSAYLYVPFYFYRESIQAFEMSGNLIALLCLFVIYILNFHNLIIYKFLFFYNAGIS